ncbi:MAG: hypothetical protein NC078_03040 [Ruminococcus sp.]|nr:hypothetical protein [Ruminococcus sp.]
MTALIVIGVIILILVLAVNLPVTAHIKFYGGRLEVGVKYMGIGILPRKKKRRKKRKRIPPPPAPADDEDIFEDIAEIGVDSGGAEEDEEYGEDFGESPAEISMDKNEKNEKNSTGISKENSGENSTENLGESPESSEKSGRNLTGNSTGNSGENPESSKENPTEKSVKGFDRKSRKKLSGKKTARGKGEDEKGGGEDGEEKSEKPKKPLDERLTEAIDGIEGKKNAALLLWELCGKPIKKLLGKISVSGLVIDFAAADEDAAKAAVKYGRLSAAFYNFLGVMMGVTRIKIKSVSVGCLYNTPAEKARYDGEMKVRLRPASVINALTAVLVGYFAGREKYKAALGEFTGKGG